MTDLIVSLKMMAGGGACAIPATPGKSCSARWAWPGSRGSPVTPNTVGIAGLGVALEFLGQVGLGRVIEHERQLMGALWEGLAAVPSVKLYGPSGPERRASLLSFNLEGWDPVEVATVLDQSFGICCRAGLHCAPWAHQALGTFPAGTVRFSVSYFNTLADVEQAVQAVRALAAAGRG